MVDHSHISVSLRGHLLIGKFRNRIHIVFQEVLIFRVAQEHGGAQKFWVCWLETLLISVNSLQHWKILRIILCTWLLGVVVAVVKRLVIWLSEICRLMIQYSICITDLLINSGSTGNLITIHRGLTVSAVIRILKFLVTLTQWKIF